MAAKKKKIKKSSFFLNGPAFTHPPPLLMTRPLAEDFFLRLPLSRVGSKQINYANVLDEVNSIQDIGTIHYSVNYSIFIILYLKLLEINQCKSSEIHTKRRYKYLYFFLFGNKILAQKIIIKEIKFPNCFSFQLWL